VEPLLFNQKNERIRFSDAQEIVIKFPDINQKIKKKATCCQVAQLGGVFDKKEKTFFPEIFSSSFCPFLPLDKSEC
jgi:hypothetical protein